MNDHKPYYQRHLPHIQPEEATYFITFRLAGSLPVEVLEELRHKRDFFQKEVEKATHEREKEVLRKQFRMVYFVQFDNALNHGSSGPTWLRDHRVAEIVKEALHYRDGCEYNLLAHCIMPNHIHLIVEVGRNVFPTAKPLYRILQSLKRHTAREVNLLLKRNGSFWQDESYDHVIRDEVELERIIHYVLENPVKAGLVHSWEQWPWSYYKLESVE